MRRRPENDDRFGACRADCSLNHCGDDVQNEAEECDDGAGNSDAYGRCTQSCMLARCGDGARAASESCDGTAGCGADCRLTVCGARQVEATNTQSWLLLEDGRLLAAGGVDSGVLREPFPSLRFQRIAVEAENGIGITLDGSLAVWGSNAALQHGLSIDDSAPSVAHLVAAGPGWRAVAAGGSRLFALHEDGSVWGAGRALRRFSPTVGDESCRSSDELHCGYPFTQLVPPGLEFVALEAGEDHLVALDRRGAVWTWGCGSSGELGDRAASALQECLGSSVPDDADCRDEPVQISAPGSAVFEIAAATATTAWLDAEGRLTRSGGDCQEDGVSSAGALAGRPRLIRIESPDGSEVRLVSLSGGPSGLLLAMDAKGRSWTLDAQGDLLRYDVRDSKPQVFDPPEAMALLDLDAGTAHALGRGLDGSVWFIGNDESDARGDGPRDDGIVWPWAPINLSGFCSCGDGSLDPGEACDDGAGNGFDAPCTPSCRHAGCGDGIVQRTRGETCDDGPENGPSSRCLRNCLERTCGNGRIDTDEECDAGIGNSDDEGPCLASCKLARCGDGVRTGAEECDFVPGCTASCTLVPGCVAQAEADEETTLLLLDDGRLFGAGRNTSGLLGRPPEVAFVPAFVELFPSLRLRTMAMAWSHGAGLTSDGLLVTWGSNSRGERGLGHFDRVESPTVIDAEHRYVAVAVGWFRTFAIRDDGALIGFGGRLPSVLDGAGWEPSPAGLACFPTPRELLPPGSGLVAISAGQLHVAGIDSEGTVLTWGCGPAGQLGSGIDPARLVSCADESMALGGYDCREAFAPVVGQRDRATTIVAIGSRTTWLNVRGGIEGDGSNCSRIMGATLGERATPAATLVVFVVPIVLLFPLKIVGLWLLANGYWIAAGLVLILAKLVGLAVTAFVFKVTRPKLLQLVWFHGLYEHVLMGLAWTRRLVAPVRRRIRKLMRMLRAERSGRALRLLWRIRRRMRAAGSGARADAPRAARTARSL